MKTSSGPRTKAHSRSKTERPSVNVKLWQAAGYPEPPDVRDMVEELAAFDYRLVWA